jgi:hypothetical protein
MSKNPKKVKVQDVNLGDENERLIGIIMTVLQTLLFDLKELRKIYNIITERTLSGVNFDLNKIIEFINYSFSKNKNLTTMREIPQIFIFDKKSRIISLVYSLCDLPTKKVKSDFIRKMKLYVPLNFAVFEQLMVKNGYSDDDKYWIMTRLELIHNTDDGPISIDKVSKKLTRTVRNDFIEIISAYDHYDTGAFAP